MNTNEHTKNQKLNDAIKRNIDGQRTFAEVADAVLKEIPSVKMHEIKDKLWDWVDLNAVSMDYDRRLHLR